MPDSTFPTTVDTFTNPNHSLGDTLQSVPHDLQHRKANDALLAIEKRAFGGWINDTEYGAVGDGSTDDTTALQNLLTAAAGKVAMLRSGKTYKVTTALSVPANTHIYGYGAAISVPAANEIHCLTVAGNGVVIEGLEINGNGSTKSTNKWGIDNSGGYDDVVVKDCYIRQWRGNGIYGVDCDRMVISGGRIGPIYRSSAAEGCAVRLKATSSDINDCRIEGLYVTTCDGTGIQADGDWNRADWPTAGVKIRRLRVVNCTSQDNDFAGIFINSGFDCTIVGCTARANTDYGIGLEFCRWTTVAGCTSYSNTTYGFAIYQSGLDNTLDGCTARANTLDGFALHIGSVLGPYTRDNVFAGCVSEGNTRHGFGIAGSVGANLLDGCIATGNSTNGIDILTSDITLSGCVSRTNTGRGVAISNGDRIIISGGDYSANTSTGIDFQSSGADQSGDCSVTGAKVYGNGSDGIKLTADTLRTAILGCAIAGNTGKGISAPSGGRHLTIRGNELQGNTSHQIDLLQPFDCMIEANTIRNIGSNRGISCPDSAGFSGGRSTIRHNTIRNGTGVGIYVSAGSNVSAGDDFYVEDNAILGVTTPYTFASMGNVAALYLKARGAGTPEGNVNAWGGSHWYRTDGGAGTSFYVKENGNNGNTGWAAK